MIQSIVRGFNQRSRRLIILQRIRDCAEGEACEAEAAARAEEESHHISRVHPRQRLPHPALAAAEGQRNSCKDFGVIIRAYSPASQINYDFSFEESALHMFMCQELGEDAVSIDDLLNMKYLQKVVSARLLVRPASRPKEPPRILFSKLALRQRGMKPMVRGRRISGHQFVCSLFETGSEYTVQSYRRLSCKVFVCDISQPDTS